MSTKEIILGTMEDMVSDFLYYDRKEDEDLPLGFIENAINTHEIDIKDIVTKFEAELLKGLSE